jgi:hypothetical protein
MHGPHINKQHVSLEHHRIIISRQRVNQKPPRAKPPLRAKPSTSETILYKTTTMSTTTDAFAGTGRNLPQLNYEHCDVWAPRMMYQLEKDDVWWTIEQVSEEPTAMDTMASFVKLGSNPTVARYKLKWKLYSKKAVHDIMANFDPTRYES